MIALFMDRFKDADVIERMQNGQKVKGIFIPLKPNKIYRTDSGFKIQLYAKELKVSKRGCSHFIGPLVTRERLEAVKRGEAERPVTIGYMTPSLYKKEKVEDLVEELHYDSILTDSGNGEGD